MQSAINLAPRRYRFIVDPEKSLHRSAPAFSPEKRKSLGVLTLDIESGNEHRRDW